MSPFQVSTDCKYDGHAAQTGNARYTQRARYACFVRTVEKVQAILSPYQRKACFGHGGQSVRNDKTPKVTFATSGVDIRYNRIDYLY